MIRREKCLSERESMHVYLCEREREWICVSDRLNVKELMVWEENGEERDNGWVKENVHGYIGRSDWVWVIMRVCENLCVRVPERKIIEVGENVNAENEW